MGAAPTVGLEPGKSFNYEWTTLAGVAAQLYNAGKRTHGFMVFNPSANGSIFVGTDATVTTSGANKGIEVPSGATLTMRVDAGKAPPFAIGTGDVLFAGVL